MIPKRGERFTISANKRCSDRSYTDNILECVEVNEITVFAKCIGGRCWSKKPILLIIDEHDFSGVSEFTLRRLQEIEKSA